MCQKKYNTDNHIKLPKRREYQPISQSATKYSARYKLFDFTWVCLKLPEFRLPLYLCLILALARCLDNPCRWLKECVQQEPMIALAGNVLHFSLLCLLRIRSILVDVSLYSHAFHFPPRTLVFNAMVIKSCIISITNSMVQIHTSEDNDSAI
jgi:hypothetical protein